MTLRVRSFVWFVSGVVLATSVTLMSVNAWSVDAAPGDSDSTLVPTAPCRLVDTRPAPVRVGPQGTLSADSAATFQATGTNGECILPSDAVGLSLNVTALGATELSFLTIWPSGDRPLAASLNPAPGEPPTPNAVTTQLSATGSFNVYNASGTVDIVVDVVGYYISTSLGEIDQRLAALEAVTTDLGQTTDELEQTTTGLEQTTNSLLDTTDDLTMAQPFTAVSPPPESEPVGAGGLPTEIISVTITAPTDGHVLTIASGYMRGVTDNAFITCGLNDSATLPADLEDMGWQANTGALWAPLSTTQVFEVTADETVTYSLMCRSTLGISSIWAPEVTATFTPS